MSDFKIPLDIESLEVTAQTLDKQDNIILDVVSKKKSSKCHKCGKDATIRNGTSPIIMIEHRGVLEKKLYLRIKPVRYKCEHCDDHITTTEQYDWHNRKSKYTKAMEEYILRSLINSTVEDVAKKEKLSSKSIYHVIENLVPVNPDWSDYKDLKTIGIDKIAVKKGHKDYVTIVSAITKSGRKSVVGVIQGKGKEDVKDFLSSIPSNLRKTVVSVCTDMYDGYVNAASEVFGKSKVVIDRFHVAKQYRSAIDKIRISEMSRLKKELPKEEYSKLHNVMWALRKEYECLSEDEKKAMEVLYSHSPLLKKAHSLAIKLTVIFNTTSTTRKDAVAKIDRWISNVEKSDIKEFDTFLVTLNKYKSSIANYFKNRATSGFVEGLNNKIKVLKRRCYGLVKTSTYFQRLYLDLKGHELYGI